MMPLLFADEGKEYKIIQIKGKDEIRRHLLNLGFNEDSNVSVIHRMGDNLIVDVKGSRVAIDSSLAKRIII